MNTLSISFMRTIGVVLLLCIVNTTFAFLTLEKEHQLSTVDQNSTVFNQSNYDEDEGVAYIRQKDRPTQTNSESFFLSADNICSGNLTTTFDDNNAQDGNMFEVKATKSVIVKRFSANIRPGTDPMEVYYKEGTFVGFEQDPSAWTKVAGPIAVNANPRGTPTEIPVDIDVTIPAGETYSFYVTGTEALGVAYKNGNNEGAEYASDNNIIFYQGIGKSYPFNSNYRPRIFNGIIHYILASDVVCNDVTVDFNGETEITVPYTDLWDDVISTTECGPLSLSDPSGGVVVNCAQIGQVINTDIEVLDAGGNVFKCISNITVSGLPCGYSADPSASVASFYDAVNQEFTLSSSQCTAAFPYTSDNKNYVLTDLCGDGYVKAYVESVNGAGFGGVALRESTDLGSKTIEIGVDKINRAFKAIRVLDNYPAYPQENYNLDKFWVKIERTGSYFKTFLSLDDNLYIPISFNAVAMADCIKAGLFVSN